MHGRAFRYTATSGRDELAAELMQEALTDAGTDRAAALVHFARTVTPDEADTLREALNELEHSGPTRSGRRQRRP